jgi:hypothetical protein
MHFIATVWLPSPLPFYTLRVQVPCGCCQRERGTCILLLLSGGLQLSGCPHPCPLPGGEGDKVSLRDSYIY